MYAPQQSKLSRFPGHLMPMAAARFMGGIPGQPEPDTPDEPVLPDDPIEPGGPAIPDQAPPIPTLKS